jgi:DNA-binding MarR family transcriptional regulator
MNNVFFRVKRAHHSCLRMSRQLLGKIITPARFDMLRAVHMHGNEYGILQGDLRDLLGVSGPVVSRMLTSLEKLGYVWREIDEDDVRRRVITLTPEGRALVVCLVYEICAAGYDAFVVDCALAGERSHDPKRCERERAILLRSLDAICTAFRDRATLDFEPDTAWLRAGVLRDLEILQ